MPASRPGCSSASPCAEVEHRRSGQILVRADGLAFIGRDPSGAENIYIATGDAGNGVLHATVAAMLLRELIPEGESCRAGLYDPRRRTLAATGAVARDVLDHAARYGNWLRPGDVRSADDVRPGSGAVVRRGFHLNAVYCDEEGRRHECKAVCPHMGGIVRWNSAEKSWDCPVHGSRYDVFKNVIHGSTN